MKDKIIIIATLLGSFSATIILLINNLLTVLGVDTTGYVDIINIVGVAIAFILLVIAVIFLGKYNSLLQKQAVDNNTTVTTALEANAGLISELLPDIGKKLLNTSKEQADQLLSVFETKMTTMVEDMLPKLAEQTMQLVTEKSQNIVEETTAKAAEVMKTMDELIPTYAKNISEAVAQTVRENNAHVSKMMAELKAVTINAQKVDTAVTDNYIKAISDAFDQILITTITKLDETISLKLAELQNSIVIPLSPVVEEQVEEPIIEEQIVEEPIIEEPLATEPIVIDNTSAGLLEEASIEYNSSEESNEIDKNQENSGETELP